MLPSKLGLALFDLFVIICAVFLLCFVDEFQFNLGVGLLFAMLLIVIALIRIYCSWAAFQKIPEFVTIVIFLIFPLLTPFYSFLRGGAIYSDMNIALQWNVNYIIIVTAVVSIGLYITAFFINKNATIKSFYPVDVESSLLLILFSCASSLLMVYLSEPGDTIIFHDKETLTNQRINGAEFAGGVFAIMFIVSSVLFRCTLEYSYSCSKTVLALYVTTTILSLLWLILHARRSEAIGIVLVILIYFINSRVLKYLLFVVFMLLFSALGYIRDTPLTEYSNDVFLFGSSKIPLPGGASNVYLTSIDIVDFLNFNNDATILWHNNLIALFPTIVVNYFNLPIAYYSDIISNNYDYNGGLYIVVPIIYEFGKFAPLALAIFLLMIYRLMKFSSNSRLLSVKIMVGVIFFYSPKWLWYEPIGSLKFSIYGFFLGLIIDLFFRKDKYLNVKKV